MRISVFAFALGSCLASSALAQAPASGSPDPAHMSRQALQAELSAARPFIANGGVEPQRPPGCGGDATRRQMDFWLGDWDISPTGATMIVGEATITSANQGCALIEDFRPFQGGRGHGLFAFDAQENKWRQTFVDSAGVWGEAEGAFENGVMTFDITHPRPPAQFPADMRRQISFQQVDADTVRQWGQRQDPTTHQWVRFFDLTYHRRAGSH